MTGNPSETVTLTRAQLNAVLKAAYPLGSDEERETVLQTAMSSAALSVPAAAVVGEPVAWRWSFDGGDTWNYGTLKPGKMRFGDPDIIEPLYAVPPALGGDK